MKKDKVFVLEIGTSKINAIVAKRGVNGTFISVAHCDKPYSGYSDGEFFDVDEFRAALRDCVGNTLSLLEKDKPTRVFVGVPGAFCRFETRRYQISFPKKKKIKKQDVVGLFQSGREYVERDGYEVIGMRALNYLADDKKVFEPIGIVSEKLGGFLSFSMCNEYFSKLLRSELNLLGITDVNFVSEAIAVKDYLLGKGALETPAIVADVGYISTSFTLYYGFGVMESESYDLGGGYIVASFVRDGICELSDAEKIKDLINLGLTGTPDMTYRTEFGQYLVGDVNQTAISVIDEIAGLLDEFTEECSLKFRNNVSVYLTGGGITHIRGVREHLSSRLGTEVEIISPTLPQRNRPEQSTIVSLVEYAFEKSEKRGR